MEWTYEIVKPFSVRQRSLYDTIPPDVPLPTAFLARSISSAVMNEAKLCFSPGEIDEVLYNSLVKGYPDCVARRPKNDLVAAVYQARGWC